MAIRSISIVEYKVEQARFLLKKMSEVELDFFAAQCFVDAFANAARSITFAMQAVISDVPVFAEWYQARQNQMKADRLFRFFNQYRRVSTHIGDTVVRGGAMGKDDSGNRVIQYFFSPVADLKEVPEDDVLTICTRYFKSLLEIVFDAMLAFKYQLDDRWYFTAENFKRLGKTEDDADEELGFPRGWMTVGDALSETDRWRTLRHTQTVGCQLNELFNTYLGKMVYGPDDEAE